MSEPRRFTVIDGQGEVADNTAVLPGDYALLVEQNAKHLRTISGLRGEITRLARVDPQAETIESLLVYWKLKCRGPRSTCKIPLDGTRATAVKKMLAMLIASDDDPDLASKLKRKDALVGAEQRAAEQIREAIDGAARFPYREKYGKRHSEPGPGLYRANDITDILKNERALEQFAGLHEYDQARIAYAHELKRRLDTQPNLRAVLASFDPQYAEILCRAIRWCQSDAI